MKKRYLEQVLKQIEKDFYKTESREQKQKLYRLACLILGKKINR